MMRDLPKDADRRAQLTELAGVLRRSIDDAPVETRAALAKQLRDTLSELDRLPKVEADPVDEISKKRQERRQGKTKSRSARTASK